MPYFSGVSADLLRLKSARVDRRRSQRDRDDEALVEVMRSSPDASSGDLALAIRTSRTSTAAGLKRLRDAGLVPNEEGISSLIEEPAAVPKWVAPLSAAAARII
jgi:hypothetical protein